MCGELAFPAGDRQTDRGDLNGHSSQHLSVSLSLSLCLLSPPGQKEARAKQMETEMSRQRHVSVYRRKESGERLCADFCFGCVVCERGICVIQ